MPRRSRLSFLLGLFHGAELPSAFVLLRLVWSFPSGNAECLMLEDVTGVARAHIHVFL